MIPSIVIFLLVASFAVFVTYMSHDDSWNNHYSKKQNAWFNIATIVFVMFIAAFASHCFGIKAGMEREALATLLRSGRGLWKRNKNANSCM